MSSLNPFAQDVATKPIGDEQLFTKAEQFIKDTYKHKFLNGGVEEPSETETTETETEEERDKRRKRKTKKNQ